MGAEFTPEFLGYTNMEKPFRFWCQKTLPLVYDDSLSYYELLGKCVNYINNLISDNASMIDNIDGLRDAYVSLQNYVNNYFDSLDVTDAIADELAKMLTSGQMSAIIEEIITTHYGSAITTLTNYMDADDNIYKRLHGKTIIALGDSMFSGSLGSVGNTWLEMLATRYGATVYNYGISGSKISMGGNTPSASDMSFRIDSILSDHATCDYFVVCGGANDYNQNVVIGEYNTHDSYTFIGAIRNMIVKIQRQYGKNCCLLFMTLYHRYDTPNSIRLTELDYANAMKNACAGLSIPCFDNYSSCGICLADNEYASPQNLWADSGIVAGQSASHHFSVAGYEYLMPKYAAYLANGYALTDNAPNPHFSELYDTTNTYKFQYVKTQETDGSWSVYGRIVMANVNYPNQFDEGDEWYYSDTITFNLPYDLQSYDNYGWNVTVAATEGACICTQPNMVQATLQFRLMRYKWSEANNVVLTLHKRCLPAQLTR